jgi:drug/metabolite transporter (DMT)-like permease
MGAGWSPGAAVTLRMLLAATVLTVPAVYQLRGRWSQLRRSWSSIGVYGLVAVAAGQLCYFNAVERMSVGVALLLEYSGILLVVLWMWLRHGQQPRPLTIAGGVTALVGLAFVLDIGGHQHVSVSGVLWGLGAATGLAVYYVLSAHSVDHLPPVVMSWAGLTVGGVTLLLAALSGAVPLHASTADAHFGSYAVSWVIPVLGMSLVAAAFAFPAGISAAGRLGARTASFIGLTEVLFAVCDAWLLLGQRPGVSQFVGGVLVLAGIALIQVDEREPEANPEVGDRALESVGA